MEKTCRRHVCDVLALRPHHHHQTFFFYSADLSFTFRSSRRGGVEEVHALTHSLTVAAAAAWALGGAGPVHGPRQLHALGFYCSPVTAAVVPDRGRWAEDFGLVHLACQLKIFHLPPITSNLSTHA
jgi:hypothetical protein